MKRFFILALLVVCAAALYAEETRLYTIDFEEPDYTPGEITGQQGWTKLGWYVADGSVVVNDPVTAAEGEQYLQGNDGGSYGAANHYKTIDISASYVAGTKLRIGAYLLCPSTATENFFLKLHNLGATGRTYDVELAEIQLSPSGSLYVYGKDRVSVSGLTQDAWHHVSIVIDPPTKTIESAEVDGEPLSGTPILYKSYDEEGANDIIDGLRFMKSGCLDGFTVDAVPEPAVLALLALIGLFAARKN